MLCTCCCNGRRRKGKIALVALRILAGAHDSGHGCKQAAQRRQQVPAKHVQLAVLVQRVESLQRLQQGRHKSKVVLRSLCWRSS